MGQKTWQKILLNDNAPSHTAKPVKDTLKSLGWDILPKPPYSLDLASSDYPLFASMGSAYAEKFFRNFEEVGKWLDEFTKYKHFFWHSFHKLPERWAKCVEADGQYFELKKLLLFENSMKIYLSELALIS
ncbi:mariner Mos1 transposase [Trichonephila clavata]|uniref:Mariner Mos1 transposase n=1 Tax=Trichonephila clavata TaxID=2740835 RepID=A0A8X6EX68_TRICU|nr:mariner Mos1 transposase [Trichonephila clavata]